MVASVEDLQVMCAGEFLEGPASVVHLSVKCLCRFKGVDWACVLVARGG